jgi:hypothetical protein
MIAMAVPKPPGRIHSDELRQKLAKEGLIRVIEPDAARFRMPAEEVARLLRLLTFSGSHPHISEGRPMQPEFIVDVILRGTLARGEDD